MATVDEGDQKAPFSIATTPKCRRGRYSFPWIAALYPWYVPYISVKQGGIKVPFLSLWYDLIWDWTQVSRTIGVLSVQEITNWKDCIDFEQNHFSRPDNITMSLKKSKFKFFFLLTWYWNVSDIFSLPDFCSHHWAKVKAFIYLLRTKTRQNQGAVSSSACMGRRVGVNDMNGKGSIPFSFQLSLLEHCVICKHNVYYVLEGYVPVKRLTGTFSYAWATDISTLSPLVYPRPTVYTPTYLSVTNMQWIRRYVWKWLQMLL